MGIIAIIRYSGRCDAVTNGERQPDGNNTTELHSRSVGRSLSSQRCSALDCVLYPSARFQAGSCEPTRIRPGFSRNLKLLLSGPGASGSRPMPDGREQEPG